MRKTYNYIKYAVKLKFLFFSLDISRRLGDCDQWCWCLSAGYGFWPMTYRLQHIL